VLVRLAEERAGGTLPAGGFLLGVTLGLGGMLTFALKISVMTLRFPMDSVTSARFSKSLWPSPTDLVRQQNVKHGPTNFNYLLPPIQQQTKHGQRPKILVTNKRLKWLM
jgi:hypothetical protein